MNKVSLHIISFAIPYPANYGGVIDVFYKIKVLNELGINIILHCFQYDDRQPTIELEKYCIEVNYYKREMNWKKAIGTTPFIVASRSNQKLINRLKEDNFPIFFEGMHTVGMANYPAFKNRKMAVRMHNIEWEYYEQLAIQEKKWTKKIYYKIESLRLKHFRHQLSHVDTLFTISRLEHEKLKHTFKNCIYLPVFHKNKNVTKQGKLGAYILYHGNLEVAENRKIVDDVIAEIIKNSNLKLPVIVAGKGEPSSFEVYKKYNNLKFVLNPSEEEMDELIINAQIHLLFTYQNTGIKLKLINAIYSGRHIVANGFMVNDTGLETICNLVNNVDDLVQVLNKLSTQTLSENEFLTRKKILEENFNTKNSALQIRQWLNHLP